ncbi:MAG TPA: hypothetical protein PLD02_15960, partial [Saprospiraceae bacterium]|nr:hypothetical protein [Saprospiraceae bacterium]
KEMERFDTGIVRHIAANKFNYPVYVALTTVCDKKYVASIQDNLYLTGLAYNYSKENLDNVAILKRNVEKNYALDYIDKTFYTDIAPQMVKMINGNYIVPFLNLYDHYKISGDVQKQEWIKTKLLSIATGTEQDAEVKAHLEKK